MFTSIFRRFLSAADPRLQKLRQFAHSPVTWFRNPFVLLVLVRPAAWVPRHAPYAWASRAGAWLVRWECVFGTECGAHVQPSCSPAPACPLLQELQPPPSPPRPLQAAAAPGAVPCTAQSNQAR
jgi:hypothetical protein